MPLDRLGPYELVERIGAGGMAETFVAVRRGPAGFEQRVCLKRILPDRATDPWFVGPFLDEARLLARMRCANIVQVHDFGESQGVYYMALELVEGADLEALLDDARASRDPLPVDACLYIAAELLSALAYAHELAADDLPLNIIHRDISPSNLLLSNHGEVKLTDFGIAKARGRSHKTKTGFIKGKLAYMSPEQVRGEPLDQRTDLFSLGVVLYELMTGEHPFEAVTDAAVVQNIIAGEHRPVRELAPELAPEVGELIESLLETSPARRPASASQALACLSNHVRFVIGRKLLAEQVTRQAARRAQHRARSAQATERAAQPYYLAATPAEDPTQGQAPSEDSAERSARAAKNTTSRPRERTPHRWTAPYAAVVLGAGAGALAMGGAWFVLSASEPEPAVVSSPRVSAPAMSRAVDDVAAEAKERALPESAQAASARERETKPAVPAQGPEPAAAKASPQQAEPLSERPAAGLGESPRQRPAAPEPQRPAAVPARAAPPSAKAALPSAKAALAPAKAAPARADTTPPSGTGPQDDTPAPDAGAALGHWTDVTLDQF